MEAWKSHGGTTVVPWQSHGSPMEEIYGSTTEARWRSPWKQVLLRMSHGIPVDVPMEVFMEELLYFRGSTMEVPWKPHGDTTEP